MNARAAERPGRPPRGDGRNRDRILAAARREFAAKGFRGATMRSIAAAARVDIALLAHYFGNKEGIFTATIELPDNAHTALVTILTSPPQQQGEQLSRYYLRLWEDPATRDQMQILARSAAINEQATQRLHDLLTGTITDPDLAAIISNRRIGFTLAMSHLLGVAFARYLAQLPALADLDFETLITHTAPAVQLHLDTPDPT